jgi:hypothetical protein
VLLYDCANKVGKKPAGLVMCNCGCKDRWDWSFIFIQVRDLNQIDGLATDKKEPHYECNHFHASSPTSGRAAQDTLVYK